MRIFIAINDEKLGPFTEEEVRRLVRKEEAKPTDLAWEEGTKNWVPLKDLITDLPKTTDRMNIPPEKPMTPFSDPKPASDALSPKGFTEKLAQYWPDRLPRSHGTFATLLLLFVLMGWATDTKGPKLDDYTYAGPNEPLEPNEPQKPTEPQNPSEGYFGDPSDEEKQRYGERSKKYQKDKKKYDEDLKQYQESKKIYDEEYEEYKEEDKAVNEANTKGERQHKIDQKSWTKRGFLGRLVGMSSEDFAK